MGYPGWERHVSLRQGDTGGNRRSDTKWRRAGRGWSVALRSVLALVCNVEVVTSAAVPHGALVVVGAPLLVWMAVRSRGRAWVLPGAALMLAGMALERLGGRHRLPIEQGGAAWCSSRAACCTCGGGGVRATVTTAFGVSACHIDEADPVPPAAYLLLAPWSRIRPSGLPVWSAGGWEHDKLLFRVRASRSVKELARWLRATARIPQRRRLGTRVQRAETGEE
jgi:hypothetical protein